MTMKLLLAGVLFALLALPATAQNIPGGTPTRIRGTIEKIDDQTLTVKSQDGQPLTITLAPNFTVSYLVKKSLDDIKAGNYIASTSTKGADGKNHAVELRIFPETLRSTPEGQFAWDLTPNSVMTSATVSAVTDTPQGQTLRVTYKGNKSEKGNPSEIIVGADTPIFGYSSGDASLLKPGAAIFTVALKKPDGSLFATRLTVEKNELEPFFPWPPPQPYARDVILREVFLKDGIRNIGQVSAKILAELRKSGYSGLSYYSVPDGFAMVTRLERVDSLGQPVETSQRWQDMDRPNFALTAFSFSEYFSALLKQREGHFRIFVFIVSPRDLVADPNAQATPEMVREWQQRGSATLPDSVANRAFSPKDKVYVLLYQFKKQEGQSATLVSDSTVAEHLHATHLSFE